MSTSSIDTPPPSLPGAARVSGRHPFRSTAALIIIALALGLALAATLGAVAWAIAAALHSASTA